MAFKKHTTNSFFGDFLYDAIVPEDHFLRIARETIDWERYTKKLLKYYKGRAKVGRAPYKPSVLLRMLFLVYLYDISERQAEEQTNLNMAMKYFVGLGADERVPDHSTLTYFKERLLESGSDSLEEVFKELIIQAKRLGVEFGEIQILDSVHTHADINIGRDNGRKSKGEDSVDKGAKWGVKHSRKVKDDQGNIHHQKECFLGYKAHVSLNEKTGIVTSLRVTSGNKYDGEYLPSLVKKDKAKRLIAKKKLEGSASRQIYAADKGYDDGDNHTFLNNEEMGDAIRIKGTRLTKKDKNKGPWLRLVESNDYKQGLKVRYKIERKFGEAKKHHGFSRAKYRSLKKYRLQTTFTFMALNLKEIMKSTAGVRLKSA